MGGGRGRMGRRPRWCGGYLRLPLRPLRLLLGALQLDVLLRGRRLRLHLRRMELALLHLLLAARRLGRHLLHVPLVLALEVAHARLQVGALGLVGRDLARVGLVRLQQQHARGGQRRSAVGALHARRWDRWRVRACAVECVCFARACVRACAFVRLPRGSPRCVCAAAPWRCGCPRAARRACAPTPRASRPPRAAAADPSAP